MENVKPFYFLLLGLVTIPLAQLNVSSDLIGWIAFVPFLAYLRMTKGIWSRITFAFVLILGWSLCIAKIVSPPMPFAMVFLYSVPISVFQLPGFLFWAKFKDHKWSIFLFPAIMTTMEWIQYTFTPLASWGVAAYSQSHTISVMQALSLFGMTGLSFLIYWVNIVIAECLVKQSKTIINWKLPAAITFSLFVFGSIRYELSKIKGHDTLTVAAVGTDSEVNGLPLPSKKMNDAVIQKLFLRTKTAANGGAKLIVWNEASTFIFPHEENAWKDALSALAKELHISLVAAYIVPTSTRPLHYKNKYVFVDLKGKLVYEYNKHQPVPGEPATNGTEPLKIINVQGTRTGAAICYDYDFPYLAQGFGNLQADIVAVPSSDWRGIDPIHTRMAAFRAVEQGHSIIRSTRFGLSAAITPYGEFVAQMSSYDANNKIMFAQIPTKHVFTLYAWVGNGFVYACRAFILYFFVQTVYTKAKTH